MSLPSLNVLVQVAVVGILTGGVYALMASGLTLVFGVMRVINIAHGAFLIFSAYLSYWLYSAYGIDPFLSVFITVPLLFVIGLFVQRYLLSRVNNDPGLGVLVTFSLALMLEGVMGSLWETTARTVRTSYTSEVIIANVGDIAIRLPVVRVAGLIAAVVAIILLHLLLKKSNMGRGIRATIQNRDAAQLMGVNVEKIQALTFAIGMASVAAGGALFSLIWTFNAGSHQVWISKMLSIIVLGGMGSLAGAFIASIFMGLVEAVAAVMMTSYISPIVFYLILFLTLIFRPQGIMGVRIREG